MPWSRSSGTPGDAADPFIPLRLLRGAGFARDELDQLLFGVAVLGFATLVPLYAQDRYGIATLAAGTLLTARAVGMIAVAGVATFALRRAGYRRPMSSASCSARSAWC